MYVTVPFYGVVVLLVVGLMLIVFGASILASKPLVEEALVGMTMLLVGVYTILLVIDGLIRSMRQGGGQSQRDCARQGGVSG